LHIHAQHVSQMELRAVQCPRAVITTFRPHRP
jgi:hypothetical protein